MHGSNVTDCDCFRMSLMIAIIDCQAGIDADSIKGNREGNHISKERDQQ